LKWFDWAEFSALIIMLLLILFGKSFGLGNYGLAIGVSLFTVSTLLSMIFGFFSKEKREIKFEQTIFVLIFIGYTVLSLSLVQKSLLVLVSLLILVTGILYILALIMWEKVLVSNRKNVPIFVLSYFIFTVLIIFLFVGLYATFGNLGSGGKIIPKNNLTTTDYLYFSTITFTSVGYGDLYPVGDAKIVSTIESYLGMVFNIAIIGVALSRFINPDKRKTKKVKK